MVKDLTSLVYTSHLQPRFVAWQQGYDPARHPITTFFPAASQHCFGAVAHYCLANYWTQQAFPQIIVQSSFGGARTTTAAKHRLPPRTLHQLVLIRYGYPARRVRDIGEADSHNFWFTRRRPGVICGCLNLEVR